MNKILFLIPLVITIAISGCISSGETGKCQTNRDEYKCSASISNGEITLSLSPSISGARLGGAYLSSCEITGSLWSCRGSTECEIISNQQPFKVKCPVSSGAYSVSFKLMKRVSGENLLNEPLVANCGSTPEGDFDCELVVAPTYLFKV